MKMAHDLLTEPILSWRDRERRRSKTTLPGVLARIANGKLVDFPRLRAHQFHPWCMFLTQLAAIALHRAGQTDPRVSEEAWRELLLALTSSKHEPWCLFVEDLTKPAFFQPPVPEKSVANWPTCERADDIDTLVTAKNHDTKTGLIASDDVEAWAYALGALQTTQGFPGRGYNPIARMNGGYGNRPRVGLATGLDLKSRFFRDIDVLLDSWPVLVKRGFGNRGVALVWCEPWDGKTSLAMEKLAPHFIEVCWRVRMCVDGPIVSCAYTTTESRRCISEIKTGDVGDPWIPIERDKAAALTVGRGGFSYKLMTRLLFEGEFEPAAAQQPRAGDGDPMWFAASAMARGQGKTEGLHERTLPLGGRARRVMFRPDDRSALGKRAQERVKRTETMRSKVLYPALKRLASGGSILADDLDARVDDIFFDHLFATVDLDEDAARLAWDKELRDLAWPELQRIIVRACLGDARRYRSISEAEGMFYGCLKKNFPDLVTAEAEQGAQS